MEKSMIRELDNFGQSIWLDNINRKMFETGKLEEMIGNGLRGMTSNPTIFEKAVSGGDDYSETMLKLAREGKTTFEIYDELTVRDVQQAADLFFSVHKSTKGLDGYVSLEVDPKLAYDKERTIKEAKRLHAKVHRPNLMIKVPATSEGCRAIEELLACGININATLIFSLEQYAETIKSYMKGMENFLKAGGDARKVRSVASIFVSRIDTTCDRLLEGKENVSLKGRAAVSNSHIIYKKFMDETSSERFIDLNQKGVNIQRVLWASTSTKNPEYKDIKYVTELIAKNTVNTLPEKTLHAFQDHGIIKEALTTDTSESENVIKKLKTLDIDVNDVCKKLLSDGVASFQKSFASLLTTIETKKDMLSGITK